LPVRTSTRQLFAVVVVAAFALAACGDDDDDEGSAATTAADIASETAPATSAAPVETTQPVETTPETLAATTVASSEPATTPSSAAPASGTPITIGAIIETSGATAQGTAATEIETMLTAWADHVNANGGLNGHPVEFKAVDTGGDAGKAQTALDEVMAADPAAIFIDAPATESSLAERLGESGLTIFGVGYNPALWGGEVKTLGLTCGPDGPIPCALPNAFPINTTFGALVEGQAYVAKAMGATKAQAIVCAEVDSCSTADPIFQAAMGSQGLEVGGGIKASLVAPDYVSECVGFIQTDVDFIQVNLSGASGPRVITDCLDQGYEGFFGTSGATFSADMQNPAIQLGGPWFVFPFFADHPEAELYRDTMAAAGIDEDAINTNTGPGVWQALQVFAKAQANLAEEFAPEDVLANMYSLDGETLDGLIPPVTFTEGEPAPARLCFYPILWDGPAGELRNLAGDDVATECIEAPAG
jgi:branched-chain amino acid transport system substrate-binding protein